MKLKTLLITILFSLVFFICLRNVNAQTYSAKLLREIPESVQILTSTEVRERATILKKLVVPVPQSCTLEQDLPINLDKEDYEFVVGKILELDLFSLNYKEDAYIWGKIEFLIAKFEMFRHLETLSKYLNHPEKYVQGGIIYTIQKLNAKEFDSKLAPLLDSPDKFIREETLRTLIQLESKKAVPALIKLLEDPNHLQRYYALMNLVKVNGIEAAPNISKLLNDDHKDNRYWALDALVKLNAREQSSKIWQLINSGQTEQTEMYAITSLVYFEDPNAVRIAAKLISEGDEKGRGLLERFTELQTKAIIPSLINILEKENFSPEGGYKDRVDIIHCLQKLKAKEAAPILRKYIKRSRFASAAAIHVLGDFGDKEAVDEIMEVFYKFLSNPPNRFTNDATNFAEAALALAKIGDERVWKDLIDVAVNPQYSYRSQIIIELNKHINPQLWQKAQEKKILYRPQQRGQIFSLKELTEIYSSETGIPIVLHFEPGKDVARRQPLAPPYKDTKGYPWTYIGYNISLLEGLREIPRTISDGTFPQNFTFIFDDKEVHILTVEKAVDWWRKNILTE